MRGLESGAMGIPYALAVYSGPTLREPKPHETIRQGVNGLRVGKGLYQIDGKLSAGGMGVTYHARLHSTQEGATPEEVKALPSRVVIKEMTFEVPEMLLTEETARVYVSDWKAAKTAKDGLVDLLSQSPSFTRRLLGEQSLARKIRADMLAKISDKTKRQVINSYLPQRPQNTQEVARGLEAYYAAALKADILAHVSGEDRKSEFTNVLSAQNYRHRPVETTDGILDRLIAFTHTPEAQVLRTDLERQKAEFLREVAILKMLEEKEVTGVPRVIGGLIRLKNDKNGMANIIDLFFAQTERPGQPLSKFLRHKKDKDPGQSFTEVYGVKAMIKYLRILEQVNKAGFVYRDGKPENTLFDSTTGEISIVDFGIAVPVDAKVIKRMEKAGIVTDAVAQGTLGYYPPEATRHIPVIDEKGDTFSAAKLLYAMLTAELQPDDNPVVFIQEQLMTTPNSIISPQLKAIISKAVAPQLENRYTPSEFREQLEAHLQRISRR